MGKVVYKTYKNLSNIIFRISDGTPSGKQHAVLLNSHVDSTLPSPGAADDAISVGVMLDMIRVFIHTPSFKPTHSIIFRELDSADSLLLNAPVFNNAEESLQDGSHLFSTQSDIRHR